MKPMKPMKPVEPVKPARAEFTSMFAKLALSFVVAFSVRAGTLEQKAFADSDLTAASQSGTHEIACTCDSFNQDEPDDSDIEEVLKFIDETDDAVMRSTPYGQG